MVDTSGGDDVKHVPMTRSTLHWGSGGHGIIVLSRVHGFVVFRDLRDEPHEPSRVFDGKASRVFVGRRLEFLREPSFNLSTHATTLSVGRR